MQTEKLKPLPKEITDEIRAILEDCRSGKLAHIQHTHHCGTAHCIAGWKEVFDYRKATGKTEIFAEGGYRFLESFTRFLEKGLEANPGATYGYAHVAWRLTDKESARLFQAKAAFAEQFALLEALERGERFE